MQKTRYKATAVLAASAVSCAIATPFSASFIGGMLQHGFMAAMVGGLADWFAVTALFKKPLGISYRTDIIIRNRERIFGELVTFIGSDLLSPANIMKIVERYDTSRMLYAYMEENSGLKKTQEFLNAVAADAIGRIDTTELAAKIKAILEGDIDKLPSNKILADMLDFAVQQGYDNRLIDFLVNELAAVVQTDEFKNLLVGAINEMKARYEGDSSRRQMVGMLLSISSEKLAELAQKKLLNSLSGIKEADSAIRAKIKEWCCQAIGQLRSNESYNSQINKYLLSTMRQYVDIVRECEGYKLKQRELFASKDKSPLNKLVEKKVRRLKLEKAWCRKIDRKIKAGIHLFLKGQHSIIMGIVKEKLNAFSDEELLSFIESRVGDDLQMIRINGSVVGGVVGMLLFILNYLVEGAFG